jgi:hypothetical protein
MTRSLSTYLKAFATVTIIGPWAMLVMSGVLFGGFVPMMGLGHPVVLVGLARVYCSALVLWRPSPNRLYRLGILVGFVLLSWVIYQNDTRLTFPADTPASNELSMLREVLGHYVVLGAWVLSVILLLPGKKTTPESS